MTAEPLPRSGQDELAQRLVISARMLSHSGIVEAFGHVSARVGAERFLLTPRIGPGLATAGHLLEVDIVTGDAQGTSRPPLEAAIHIGVYEARPDVMAVARIHSFAASVLSVAGHSVRPCHYLGTILDGAAPVHESTDLVTTKSRGAAVARELADRTAVLLQGNGQVVVGSSLEEATVRALYLDEAARMQLAASSLGEPRFLDDDQLERARVTWRDVVNVQRAWDFHRSRLPEGL